ncbi:MAG: tetratricopeptide repeat protein [Burkholderiales bacterium]|nr:tetratricopeptide repeat protein [Burkholderiales bacterium]
MPYDLEEQEQLAALKAWWSDYGRYVLAALAAAALAIAGWAGWRAWNLAQARAAGEHYEAFARALQAADDKALREAAGTLAERYPRTLYASLAALAVAKHLFERNDLKGAKAQLQWVLERGASDELRDLARLRLAAVLFDEKSYEEALKLLEAKHAAAFQAPYAALRGDILAAQNRPEEARAAYRDALAKSEPLGEAFRASVRLRLDALGG